MDTGIPSAVVYVTGKPVTLYVTLLVVPSSDVVTTAVVFKPFTKFTVSYGFTKSFAVPLFCKFQPAFNTSDTVAALLPMYLGFGCPSFVLGLDNSAASVAVNGALLMFATSPAAGFSFPSASVIVLEPSFTFGMLFFTLFKDVGLFVPFGPLIVVLTGPVTSSPFPSGFVLKIWFPSLSVLPVGYTCLPSLSVYTTGVTALFVDVWSSTFTVIVRTPWSSVLPDTTAVPSPTNFTSLAFFTVAEYSSVVTAPFSPVVLLEDTIQPMLRRSPTVAAVLSLTFGASPFAGLDKSTKPLFAFVEPGTSFPSTVSPYLSKPDVTLPNCVAVVVLGLSPAGVGLTNAVFNGFVVSTGSITLLFSSTNLPSLFVPTAGLPASLIG